ncbi:489_t:CDS:2 [Entrophospora sp. SA101]|nr:489_t:CDS:2 [Entrophospora sp. SA101]
MFLSNKKYAQKLIRNFRLPSEELTWEKLNAVSNAQSLPIEGNQFCSSSCREEFHDLVCDKCQIKIFDTPHYVNKEEKEGVICFDCANTKCIECHKTIPHSSGYFQKLLPGPEGQKIKSSNTGNYLPLCRICQAKKTHQSGEEDLLRGNNYQKVLVAFDSTKINFRHQIYPEYKIHRLATPPRLLQQLNTLKDLLMQSEVPVVELDKDLMQLLSPQVKIYKYSQGEIIAFTEQDFWQEYNFSPGNYIDYLCLLGDQVDNVQGVNGIGIKTAQQLIQSFKTIEKIYQNGQQLSPKVQELLTKNQELVFQNKQLITLKNDLILPIN